MAVAILMGMKKQPNYKTYWMKVSLFHCDMISNIFTKARLMELQRCLHVTSRAIYEDVQRGEPGYNKLRQTRWLVNAICDSCKAVWHLEKTLTVDEMIIRHKDT